MSGLLLDTNVVSEYARAKGPEKQVRRWVDQQQENTLYLCVLTIGEVRNGIVRLADGKKRQQLQQWLETELKERFGQCLLPINSEIADIWGTITGQFQMKGITLPIVDGLIAATAIYHKLTLVTRNTKDFTMWGVPLLNPWEIN